MKKEIKMDGETFAETMKVLKKGVPLVYKEIQRMLMEKIICIEDLDKK